VSAAAPAGADALSIRPLDPAMAPRMFPLLADPRLYAWIPDAPPDSERALAARIARLCAGAPAGRDERWLNWALYAGDGPVGTLQATVQGDGVALIAYVVFVPAQRRGHATAACRWLVERLFGDASVQVVRACVDTRNHASQRVAARAGLRRVGRVRATDLGDGRPSEDLVYERTRGEHDRARPAGRRGA
jgi:RimJ/RimL family protein N-acetyltransferase